MSTPIIARTRLCLALVCLQRFFTSSHYVFCDMTASVHRSEAIEEEEQEQEQSKSRGFLSNLLDEIFARPINSPLDVIGEPDCFTCAALGQDSDFNAPLYDHCDVVLLNSIFDENFAYSINGQTSILVSELDFMDDPSNVMTQAATEIDTQGGIFSLHFEPIPRTTLPNVMVSSTTSFSAPSFRAIFSGLSSNGTQFFNALSCTLLPSSRIEFAQASCNGSLTSLVNANIIPALTQAQSEDHVALQVFTLTFKRNRYCTSDFLSLVSSNAIPSVSAPGFGLPTGQPINQQTTLTATRVFKKQFPPPPPNPPPNPPPPNVPAPPPR